MRDKVASGVAWSIAEKVGSMLLQMGVSIVILRLLTPEQMGIMAIPVVFSSLALVMVEMCIRDRDEEYIIQYGYGAVRDHTARFRRRGSGPYDYLSLIHIYQCVRRCYVLRGGCFALWWRNGVYVRLLGIRGLCDGL